MDTSTPAELTSPITRRAVRWTHWVLDGAMLGGFMVSACTFGVLLEHPASPVRQAIADGFLRRAMMGLAMGTTAVSLIYSRWGRRTGAVLNPAAAASFMQLGKLSLVDAIGYAAAQFAGAAAGVLLVSMVIPDLVGDPAVGYVATRPGRWGVGVAWIAEFVIALALMTMVLTLNRIPTLLPYTGWFVGGLVAVYITFEAPISGMSLNPARSFGSAVVSGDLAHLWVYFTAPVLGMLAAVEVQRRMGVHSVCGKLVHSRHADCAIPCDCLK